MLEGITGSSVSATATEISGISIPATPTERRNETGSTISASRPTATVGPLNITARPAVCIAGRRPRARSGLAAPTRANAPFA